MQELVTEQSDQDMGSGHRFQRLGVNRGNAGHNQEAAVSSDLHKDAGTQKLNNGKPDAHFVPPP